MIFKQLRAGIRRAFATTTETNTTKIKMMDTGIYTWIGFAILTGVFGYYMEYPHLSTAYCILNRA